MTQLSGDWKLASGDQQEGKATKHKLVAPMIGTDQTAMAFKIIGKGSTVQKDLLLGSKKQMVTMYHFEDDDCNQLRATHYCGKQNQPRLLANLKETMANRLVFNCDMSTELCDSKSDHVHSITHKLGDDGTELRTTYVSWKGGKHLKEIGVRLRQEITEAPGAVG